jgi:hypothetical protein
VAGRLSATATRRGNRTTNIRINREKKGEAYVATYSARAFPGFQQRCAAR